MSLFQEYHLLNTLLISITWLDRLRKDSIEIDTRGVSTCGEKLHGLISSLLNFIDQRSDLFSENIEDLQSYLRSSGQIVANSCGGVERVRVIRAQRENFWDFSGLVCTVSGYVLICRSRTEKLP